jgi:hypothetical protein
MLCVSKKKEKNTNFEQKIENAPRRTVANNKKGKNFHKKATQGWPNAKSVLRYFNGAARLGDTNRRLP